LTDLVGDSKAPAASSQPDAAPSQGAAVVGAVSGAVGLTMPALIGSADDTSIAAPTNAPARAISVSPTARRDGLSADVGRPARRGRWATGPCCPTVGDTRRHRLRLNTSVTVLRTETHCQYAQPSSAETVGQSAELWRRPAAPDSASRCWPQPGSPSCRIGRTLDIERAPSWPLGPLSGTS